MTDLLKYTSLRKIGTEWYELLADNGVLLGKIYREIDGYYVFNPDLSRGGFWNEHLMDIISARLKDLNAEWDKHLDEYLSGEQNAK